MRAPRAPLFVYDAKRLERRDERLVIIAPSRWQPIGGEDYDTSV